MTKKIQDIALSFFLVTLTISVLMGMLWLRPVIESQRLLIKDTRINQEKIMKSAEEIRTIMTELGYATAVIAMMENRMIQPTDANKIIEDSIATIQAHSERLGKLVGIINDFRINKQGRK